MKYLSLDLARLRNSDTWAQAHKHPWMGLACHNLWYAAADRDGEGIPDDDEILARLAGIKKNEWKKIKKLVLSSWKLSEGKWTHPIIVEEANRFLKSVESGKKGANRRWKASQIDSPPNGSPNGATISPPNRVANSPPNTNSPVLSSPVQSTTTRAREPDKLTPIDRIAKAMGLDVGQPMRRPSFQRFPGFLSDWIAAGCDPERDVWPTIERVAKGKTEISSPKFFELAIFDARDKRVASEPSEAERWTTRIAAYFKSEFWDPKHWGPNPDEPGCLAPPELVDQLRKAKRK